MSPHQLALHFILTFLSAIRRLCTLPLPLTAVIALCFSVLCTWCLSVGHAGARTCAVDTATAGINIAPFAIILSVGTFIHRTQRFLYLLYSFVYYLYLQLHRCCRSSLHLWFHFLLEKKKKLILVGKVMGATTRKTALLVFLTHKFTRLFMASPWTERASHKKTAQHTI